MVCYAAAYTPCAPVVWLLKLLRVPLDCNPSEHYSDWLIWDCWLVKGVVSVGMAACRLGVASRYHHDEVLPLDMRQYRG